MPPESVQRAERLRVGEPLLLVWDFQNPHDANALAVRTAETLPGDVYLLGYCPRYLRGEILRLMTRDNPPVLTVERLNVVPAPLQFRVLCRLRMQWTAEFEPFANAEYQPIVGSDESEAVLQSA